MDGGSGVGANRDREKAESEMRVFFGAGGERHRTETEM